MAGENISLNHCSAQLIELRNAIKQELDDEGAASHKYADMAAKFTHLREPQRADILRLIAADELLHIKRGIVGSNRMRVRE